MDQGKKTWGNFYSILNCMKVKIVSQNLWEAAKVVIEKKFITATPISEKKISNNNVSFYFIKLGKEEQTPKPS